MSSSNTQELAKVISQLQTRIQTLEVENQETHQTCLNLTQRLVSLSAFWEASTVV